jgi:hypothetical protein
MHTTRGTYCWRSILLAQHSLQLTRVRDGQGDRRRPTSAAARLQQADDVHALNHCTSMRSLVVVV